MYLIGMVRLMQGLWVATLGFPRLKFTHTPFPSQTHSKQNMPRIFMSYSTGKPHIEISWFRPELDVKRERTAELDILIF